MSNLAVSEWRTWKNAPTDPPTAVIQAAIDAALENGATAEELAPVQAEIDALNAAGDALAAAVVANT